jgi:hypothetical protein
VVKQGMNVNKYKTMNIQNAAQAVVFVVAVVVVVVVNLLLCAQIAD